MCGRFAFYSPAEATAALFGVSDVPAIKPRFNIAPTQDIAAVRVGGDESREVALLRWGLIPFWAKDPSIGSRMINARAETVEEKPSFRAAYRKRRCLVLADGFYEWRKVAGGKTPYFISLASGEPFAFAGLWEDWHAKDSDDSVQSATIITTSANDFMSQLHDRMPVVLAQETVDQWLDGDDKVLSKVAEHSPALRAWPVDRRVNNARNEGEDLIKSTGTSLSA
jgi:putative SOS response-associated peptidase YedK